MEIKRNEATINRPGGDRVLDAPFVFLDIPEFIQQLKNEKTWKENDRNAITIFKSDRITMVVSILKQGAKISDNRIDDFLIAQVIVGEAEVSTIEGEFKAGINEAVTFHPGVQHSITALMETVLLITTFNDQKKTP